MAEGDQQPEAAGGTVPPSTPPTREEMLAAARAFYAGNYSRKYARKKLLEAGCPEAAVDAVVEQAWQAYVADQRRAGLVQFLIGAVMLAVGIGITVAATRDAEQGGGGGYVVMTGLIVVGAWNVFRGAVRGIGGR